MIEPEHGQEETKFGTVGWMTSSETFVIAMIGEQGVAVEGYPLMKFWETFTYDQPFEIPWVLV